MRKNGTSSKATKFFRETIQDANDGSGISRNRTGFLWRLSRASGRTSTRFSTLQAPIRDAGQVQRSKIQDEIVREFDNQQSSRDRLAIQHEQQEPLHAPPLLEQHPVLPF